MELNGMDIKIPESMLRDVVAAQLATRFSDPEIMKTFVSTILDTRVDSFGRTTTNSNSPTLLRWAIEDIIRQFIRETAKAWLDDQYDEFVHIIREELGKFDLILRLTKETLAKVTIK